MPPVDQRHIETAQYKAGERPAGARVQSSPDDETDPSAERLEVSAVGDTSSGQGNWRGQQNWHLNTLGAVLGTALICALLLSVGLWVKLQRTRAELSEAELAAEMAEAALASDPEPEPEEKPNAAARFAAQVAAQVAAPVKEEPVDLTSSRGHPGPQAVAPPDDQLVLLLTVGTQHYAEKQLRTLRKRCRAQLAVYQQRRGRCGWSQCWAVAVPAAEREQARGCGAVRGQALRDRKDFLQLP